MTAPQLLQSITSDLQRDPRGVVYLEGKTDPLVLVGLLGIDPPPGPEPTHQVVDGIGIRGLGEHQGSGKAAVRARLQAVKGTALDAKVRGIVDGDGRALAALTGEFDAPYGGPAFSWKGYSIENLLARAAWPDAWGPAPTWAETLMTYAPYVALTRMRNTIVRELEGAKLHRYTNPSLSVDQPLLDPSVVEHELNAATFTVRDQPLGAWFRRELDAFAALLRSGRIDEAHALLNGKWLVSHLAAGLTKRPADECREAWARWVGRNGGLAEVKDLWARMWAPPAPAPAPAVAPGP